MNKSTITRERIEQYANDPLMCNINDEIRELARLALAAMGSEPVAWTDEEELRDVKVAGIGYLFGIEREANKFADPRRQIMLYRHAQPAPVVPDEMPKGLAGQIVSLLAHNIGDKLLAQKIWNTCRAAMLQTGSFREIPETSTSAPREKSK